MNLREALSGFGESLHQGARSARPLTTPFRRILVCGMGGSSVAGEMLALIRDDVIVHPDAGLPDGAAVTDLVVCVSWSGNTAEVLAAYDDARALGAPLAVITSGGTLAQRAKTDGVALTLLPHNDAPPRANAGLMTGALLAMIGSADALPAIDATALESEGKTLADAIGDRLPVFYASYPSRALATWFKTTVNENAKRHAWASSFPSAAHNEIMGWKTASPDMFIPVVIGDLPQVVAFFRQMGYTVSTAQISGSVPLEQAINGYILALWTSYYLALNAGVDPADTTIIETFKQSRS